MNKKRPTETKTQTTTVLGKNSNSVNCKLNRRLKA